MVLAFYKFADGNIVALEVSAGMVMSEAIIAEECLKEAPDRLDLLKMKKDEMKTMLSSLNLKMTNFSKLTKGAVADKVIEVWDFMVMPRAVRISMEVKKDDNAIADAQPASSSAGAEEVKPEPIVDECSDESSSEIVDSDGFSVVSGGSDDFLYFHEDLEIGEVIDEDRIKVILKNKGGSRKITLYLHPSATVKALANEISWLTELDGHYFLIGQNTWKAWDMRRTIASLSQDDYTAYIQLKMKGGGKRSAGGKAKADKESKMKDLTEKVGMALLRIGAGTPPDYIQRIVQNIMTLKNRLATKPDLVMDGLITLSDEELKKLQVGLGSTHTYLKVIAMTKALYPAEHIQLEENAKICEYLLDAMKGFVELCLLSHYGNDDGTFQWQKVGGDVLEIVSKRGGYNQPNATPAGANATGADARGLGA